MISRITEGWTPQLEGHNISVVVGGHNNDSPKGGKYYQEFIILFLKKSTVGPRLSEHLCHFNAKGDQINEFVRISELSDNIHYLAS